MLSKEMNDVTGFGDAVLIWEGDGCKAFDERMHREHGGAECRCECYTV